MDEKDISNTKALAADPTNDDGNPQGLSLIHI